MRGTIKKTLLDIGFSDKEAKIYIHLGKRGPQKGGTIAKDLKINKGQVYRTLKALEKKGSVESTLEYPARFIAVPIQNVIDSFIKSKQEEVDQIEETKKDLVSDWNNIRQIEVDSSLEKFSVIEGEKNVFHKISQMIKEAKNELLTVVSVNALLKANLYGLFEDMSDHPLKSRMKFRFLTQLTKKDVKPIKLLLKKIEADLDFKGKDPNRSSLICPRMVIKDKDEILLFISDRTDNSLKNKIEAVLCTNCQSIIGSFYGVFQDLWNQGNNIQEKIEELETGKSSSIMELIKNSNDAKNKYYTSLDDAKKEIFIVTSSKRLDEIAKNINLIEKWCQKGVSIKIMAPITNENLKAVQTLLTCSEVKHIPVGYREITIIDEEKLFQFNPYSSNVYYSDLLNYNNVLFTNEINYINQTKEIISNLWKKTRTSIPVEIESRVDYFKHANFPSIKKTRHYIMKRINLFQEFTEKKSNYSEQDVVEKLRFADRFNISNSKIDYSKISTRYFGTAAFSIIHPPKELDLPEFIIGVWKFNKKSSFGPEDLVHIYTKSRSKKNNLFELGAVVQNNSSSYDFRKNVFASSRVSNNISLVDNEKFHVTIAGSTLFVCWAFSIPLVDSKIVIPPACILFEGYGEIESGELSCHFPYARRYDVVHNTFDAFTTFFHSSSNSSGPGTEGYISREFMVTTYPGSTIGLG